jgi:signal transduction histidine kinase
LVVYQSDLGLVPLTLLRRAIGTQTPILLAAGFDGPEEQEHFRALDALPNTARIIRGDLLGPAVMNILKLFPGTKEIVTVSPGGPLDMFDMTRIITRFPDLQFFHRTVATDEKLAEVLDSLPSHAALVTMNLAKNVNSSMRFSFGGTLEPLLPPSRVPIFPLALSQFDGNVVGGPMGDGAAYGRMIGEQVTALLRGADPDTLPVRIYDQWEVRYNWDQLVRYGIPVSALPPNATVVGRANAVWRDHRTIIVSVLVFFAGLAAFLLLSMRNTAKVRQSLRADQLRAREQARIQDAERLRIARDLHDSIGQGLSLIALRLDRMQNEGGPPVRSEDARALLRELRGIVDNLQPMDLRQQPLPDAIRHLLAEVERTTGMVTDLIVHMETLPAWLQLSEPEAAAILRITQEAVHNVITHAEAHRCTVRMERTPDGALRVCITDDGIGLPQESGFASGHGVGLASIRGRAASIGWTATISTGLVHGTSVSVEQTCASVVSPAELAEG